MIGEISIGGVFFPALLILAMIALIVTAALIRLLTIIGAYRWFALRPFVNVSVFVIVLWVICLLTTPLEPPY